MVEQSKEEVFLRIYDITNGMASVFSQEMLGFKIDGVWHTSLELFGNEYFFQSQVSIQKAGTTMFQNCKERISMGYTNCSMEDLEDFINGSRELWTPESYDIFENNCNNFTDFLLNFLTEQRVPSYILELPAQVKSCPNFRKLFPMSK